MVIDTVELLRQLRDGERIVRVEDAELLDDAAAEIVRLRAALAKANEQAECFERGWYQRGDALEKLQQWADAYPVEVFPEPLRQEWEKAHEVLALAGLSMTRMSASNMRHVINGVREIVSKGLEPNAGNEGRREASVPLD